MKTLLIIVLFIIALVVIAFSFSLFFQPEDKLRYNECILLQNPETKEVDCFGCVGDNCKDAPLRWILYKKPAVGIPYACFETKNGCALAQ